MQWCYGFGKEARMNPMDIAKNIVAVIADTSWFSNVNIAAPGFINFSLTQDFLADWCTGLLHDARSGCPIHADKKTVVIDFGGPNIAKPMHVGHITL